VAIEKPKYTVLKKDGKFEIREYEDQILAEVEIEGEWGSALNKGFRVLAGYIFGANKSKAKIAMTAPVTEQRGYQKGKIPMTAPVTASKVNEKRHKISFMMPAKYTTDTLPEPDSEEITFRKVKKHKAAVIRFSGYLRERLLEKKSEELKHWVKREGIIPKSEFISAQYNPPWIPGLFRRNEIIVHM
jgi:DNA gyrase inhibitor GyrI